jgi:hypothetical protein
MIKIGDIYRIPMDNSDGIKPKGSDTYRNKFIVIIGSDGNGYFGAVVTNTKDHHLIPIEFQYPLNHEGYACFVNCFKLYEVSSERLPQVLYRGNVSDEDLELIMDCVRTSPRISENTLKRYGLI